MKRLLLASSAVALICSPVFADHHEDGEAHDAITYEETMMDVDGDGSPETLVNGYTDQHAWVNSGVFIGDQRIAEIERVHYAGDEIDTVVVEYGGVADLGGREVELALDAVAMTETADGDTQFQLNLTKDELDAMPAFDERYASLAAARADDALDDSELDETETADYGDEDVDLADNEIQVDIDGDGSLETLINGYTDQHSWVGAKVSAEGETIGEIERVHFDGETINAVVVETGGVVEIGGREVELDLEQAEMTTDEDGVTSFALALTKAQFEALPDFEESMASHYPLSDNPLESDEPDGSE